MTEYELIKSQRGKDLLVYQNHLYTFDYTRDGITRWRCQNRACRGSVFFNTEHNLIKSIAHTHDVITEKIEKLKLVQSIRNRAMVTTERASDVIASHLTSIQNDDTVGIMPHVASLRDYIRRERNKLLEYIPGAHQDIPESLKRDERGNIFLRYDSGYSDPNRIIIFCSEYKKDFIQKIDTFVVDGTFRSAPQGFYQVLVFHGFLFGKSFPFIYILMSNKTEESYNNAFNKCKELFLINPSFIITDFERALINATSTCFARVSSFGCLFHLGQAIWARIGNLGLINRYKTDANFKKVIKMMLCLSFMPIQNVLIGYRYIKQLIIDLNIQNLSSFITYFEKNYIGAYNEETGEYINPYYNISFWNVYNRILLNLPRTSNNAESWNRTLNLRTEVANPNIAQFITDLLRQEEIDIFNLKRAKIGIFQTNKKYIKEEKIRICVENYKFFSTSAYLDAIMKHYNFQFDEEDSEETINNE